MPTLPTAEETQEEFIQRCIPAVISEDGVEGDDQANAICQTIWADAQEPAEAVEEAPIEEVPVAAAFSHSSRNMQPITGRKYMKDIMKVGNYVHGDGEEVEVTASHLKNWVTQFKAMKKNGVKVPVPVGHTDADAANAGWINSMAVVNDTLYASLTLGEGKQNLVDTQDVSIYAAKDFQDGLGNKYQNPIIHVALVSAPLVPGLNDFVELAASRVPVFTLGNGEMEPIADEAITSEDKTVSKLQAEVKELKAALRSKKMAERGSVIATQTITNPINQKTLDEQNDEVCERMGWK